MTDFQWSLLIVESVGCLAVALFRTNLSVGVTSALFAGWLIGGAASAYHPFFAVPAAAFHISIYMALAWLVFVISRRIRPGKNERLVGRWRRWRTWSIIFASFLGAYQFGAGASLIDGAIAAVVQAGLLSAAYAFVVILHVRAELQQSRLDATIDADLEHMRAGAIASGNEAQRRE